MGKFWFALFTAFSLPLLALLATVPLAEGREAGQDKTPGKDKSTPQGKPDPAKVKGQIEKVGQYYKQVLEVEDVPLQELNHFIVVGLAPGKPADQIARDLEQAYLKACKVLELAKDPGPWPGKLVVIVLQEPRQYSRMVRVAQRRKAEEDETASRFNQEDALVHVLVCPSKMLGDLGISAGACTQMAAMLANIKAKTELPVWLAEGFGRATTLQAGPPATLTTERRKAAAFVVRNKRTANDVIDNTNLGPDETPVLRASVADYLAYSGRTGKFLPFLSGFATDGKNNPGSLESAFKKSNMTREELNNNWERYAKGTN